MEPSFMINLIPRSWPSSFYAVKGLGLRLLHDYLPHLQYSKTSVLCSRLFLNGCNSFYLCRYCQFQESSCSNRLLASRRSLALSLFLLLNYGLFVVDRIQTYPSGNFRGGSEVSVDYLRPSVHFLRPHAARIM